MHLSMVLATGLVIIACNSFAQSHPCDPVLRDTKIAYLSNDVLRLSFLSLLDEKTYNRRKQELASNFGDIGLDWSSTQNTIRKMAQSKKLDLTNESARTFLQSGLPAEAIIEWGKCMDGQKLTLRVRNFDDQGGVLELRYRPGENPVKLPLRFFRDNLLSLPSGLLPSTVFGDVTQTVPVTREKPGEKASFTLKVGDLGDTLVLPRWVETCSPPAPRQLEQRTFSRGRGFCFGGTRAPGPNPYPIPFEERMMITRVTVDAHDAHGRVRHAKLVLQLDGKPFDRGIDVPDRLGELSWKLEREAGYIGLHSKQRDDYPGDEATCIYKVRVDGYPLREAACAAQLSAKRSAPSATMK